MKYEKEMNAAVTKYCDGIEDLEWREWRGYSFQDGWNAAIEMYEQRSCENCRSNKTRDCPVLVLDLYERIRFSCRFHQPKNSEAK